MTTQPLPRGRHVVLTDHVRLVHSGIGRALLTRSQALAEQFDAEIEILTVDRVQLPVEETEAALRELGLIGDRVRIVSMWDDLRAWGVDAEVSEPAISREETTPGQVTVRGHRRRGKPETWPTIWCLYAYWLRRRYGRERVNCIVDIPELADFLATAPPRHWAITYANHADHRGRRRRWKRLAPKRGYLTLHLDQFDAAVYPTAAERDLLLESGPRAARRARTFVVPLIVPAPRADPTDRDPARGVVLARADRGKRLEHAVAAARLVPQARLDLYVPDMPWTQDDRQRLLDLAADLPHVTIHPATQEADQILEASGFLLLTSRSEGFGLTMVEAQAAGCIPVAYDVRYGPAEIITPGVTGFLVTPPSDDDDDDRAIADLAAAIRRAMAAPDTMRDACRAASLRYRADAVAALWAEVLRAARAHADRRRYRRVSDAELAETHRRALDWRHPMGNKGPRYT
ncbi:MAG TPA: glycosyltransferase [Aeromicrobium sp.]|nr:glycosyltransferase [Aeromicrobium sp.]